MTIIMIEKPFDQEEASELPVGTVVIGMFESCVTSFAITLRSQIHF